MSFTIFFEDVALMSAITVREDVAGDILSRGSSEEHWQAVYVRSIQDGCHTIRSDVVLTKRMVILLYKQPRKQDEMKKCNVVKIWLNDTWK